MMATAKDDRGLWKKALVTVPVIVIIGFAMGVRVQQRLRQRLV